MPAVADPNDFEVVAHPNDYEAVGDANPDAYLKAKGKVEAGRINFSTGTPPETKQTFRQFVGLPPATVEPVSPAPRTGPDPNDRTAPSLPEFMFKSPVEIPRAEPSPGDPLATRALKAAQNIASETAGALAPANLAAPLPALAAGLPSLVKADIGKAKDVFTEPAGSQKQLEAAGSLALQAAIPFLAKKGAALLEEPKPVTVQPETAPNAISQPETAPVNGPVQQPKEPQESAGQVPAAQGSQGVPASGPGPQVQEVSPLPKDKEVSVKAKTPDGADLEIKMNAQEAERMLNRRKNNFQALTDCLGL